MREFTTGIQQANLTREFGKRISKRNCRIVNERNSKGIRERIR